MYDIQYCFIYRPSDSIVSEDAGIDPRIVATTALAVRCSNHSARSHPHSARSHPRSARSHSHSARSHPHSARSHPHSARSHPHSARSHVDYLWYRREMHRSYMGQNIGTKVWGVTTNRKIASWLRCRICMIGLHYEYYQSFLFWPLGSVQNTGSNFQRMPFFKSD